MKKTVFLLWVSIGVSVIGFAQQPAYKNKNLSPEARARDLIARMNIDEKLMQLQCVWQQKSTFFTNGDFDERKAEQLLKNGLGEIARITENKGPAGTGFHPALHPKAGAELYGFLSRKPG